MQHDTNVLWLRCKASPGQFGSELAVNGKEYNGEEFSLFVDRRFVECPDFDDQESVDALLRVEQLERDGSLILVALPGHTLANGKNITVSAEALEEYQTCQ